MSGISTHILDVSSGCPASGVTMELEILSAAGWKFLKSATTDSDGRVQQLLPAEEELAVGTYRIVFKVAGYYQAQGVVGLYPEVAISFVVREAAAHYHIPLLLTANGYTTYRGS